MKQSKRKPTLSLQLLLWWHHGINNAMMREASMWAVSGQQWEVSGNMWAVSNDMRSKFSFKKYNPYDLNSLAINEMQGDSWH